MDDKEYAKDICHQNSSAVKRIQEEFADRLLFISSKFVNSYQGAEGWIYITNKGKRIKVTDEISDTYLWLMKQLVKKCCKYEGKNNASLSTYLIAVLNSKFTFNDWLKWKYGGTTYIPKCLQHLKNPHQEIFISLRRGKNEIQIADERGIPLEKVKEHKKEIETILDKNNLIDMIEEPVFKNFDDLKHYLENGTLKPEQTVIINEVIEVVTEALGTLHVYEKRLLLLYWAKGLSSKEIIRFINSSDSITDFTPLGLGKTADIYKSIRSINRKMLNFIENNKDKFYKKYDFTRKQFKTVVKTVLENFSLKM